jgi:hypothetical protein
VWHLIISVTNTPTTLVLNFLSRACCGASLQQPACSEQQISTVQTQAQFGQNTFSGDLVCRYGTRQFSIQLKLAVFCPAEFFTKTEILYGQCVLSA